MCPADSALGIFRTPDPDLHVCVSGHRILRPREPCSTSLLLLIRVCESNIIFLFVHLPSNCLSHYLLLNHWAEFNQSCLITSPHDKGVREQHYFSLHRSKCLWSAHLCIMLFPRPLGGIQPNCPHGKGV